MCAHTHTRTFWDSASQRIPLIFLLLSQSFNHNKTPLLCRPLYIVLEDGWHTCTNTQSKCFSSLRLVRLKSGEIGSLSCMYWIKFFVSQYQDIWSCLITNANVNTHTEEQTHFSLIHSLKPTGRSECMLTLETFIRQWNHMIAFCPN